MAGRLKSDEIPSLNPRQLAALQAASPTPDQILAHMDDFNDEIVEQAQAVGVDIPETQPEEQPLPKTEVQEVEDLDALNAKLQKQLEEQEARRAAEAAAAPEPEADPQQEEETLEQQVLKMLKSASNAPSEQQIAQWKAQHGQSGVQVIALGKGDVYVFTYLRRGAFQKIQAAIAKAQQLDGMAKDPEELMMEQVLKQCILWPRPLTVEFFYNSRSGVIPTLYSAVMLNSYHLTPQQAMVLTAEL